MGDVNLVLDPFNLAFDLFFGWMAYASGWGRIMWRAIVANHYGFVWPGKVKSLGMVGPEDELR